jgi:DNA-directed RNA polymerase specialized sigma24 family protein
MTIAHHKAMDHFRAGARRPVPVAAVPEPPAGAAAAPRATDESGLWARVAELPPKMRAAVALRYVADASYAEMAVTMSCSEDAARRSVFEGLKRLREVMSR